MARSHGLKMVASGVAQLGVILQAEAQAEASYMPS